MVTVWVVGPMPENPTQEDDVLSMLHTALEASGARVQRLSPEAEARWSENLEQPIADIPHLLIIDGARARLNDAALIKSIKATAPWCHLPVVVVDERDEGDELYALGVASNVVMAPGATELARIFAHYWTHTIILPEASTLRGIRSPGT
ncbi:MAG: hypothetical protein ACE366_17150 [Bradymonadia bacterium]